MIGPGDNLALRDAWTALPEPLARSLSELGSSTPGALSKLVTDDADDLVEVSRALVGSKFHHQYLV
ncbi:hypothetical protein N9L68_03540 [bacterium]|nr:hypothetical protein [bacterium]